MTVELDFVEDLVNQLRTELIAAGFNEAADRAIVSDDEIGILYFNSLIRTIDAKPRKVLTSSMYAKTLPKAHEPKVKALLEKIRRGDDLVPHQSRKLVMKKLLQHDGMLNDWGIHHLHLESKGTAELLMCHVADDSLYAVGFWPHESWAADEIISAMIDSWPEVFERYHLVGVEAPPLTEEQRKNLRSKNGNALFRHPTRGSYAPIGGGLNSAGANIVATTTYDRLVADVESIEECVRKELSTIARRETRRLILKFAGHAPVQIFDPNTGRTVPLAIT